MLAAGADGIRRSLAPPPPVAGDAYRAAADVIGTPLPRTLDEALGALEADAAIRAALGPEIVATFLAVKRAESDRHHAWVSDWDVAEYLDHL